MGFLALGAVVAVVEVLMTVLAIAFSIYASLALIGMVVFSVIGIRRVLAAPPQRTKPTPRLRNCKALTTRQVTSLI